ncbi:MerR family transcriptional regulator [Gehongia tenuis]|uniref:MerR family transcriptional regulator n=1 Tax=Gehongia tenuis TaxID=2763655 RepID=A0A926D7K5_9FIRM|nr:MerR family transcriptional regulator [Gehongia tenuis]MBC8532319.1 MerR family transcriptional regulator [Gehongia tenuis]
MQTYKTAQVAQIVGVHPNTVRLYEDLKLIPKPERKPNGYRVFTDFHIDVFRLARTAFQIEVLQNGLRKKIVSMVKTAAQGDFDTALTLTSEYLSQAQTEKENADEAIRITKKILSGTSDTDALELKRSDTAKHLQISMDTLRNWEMNGLLSVKRKMNGYRVYTGEDINRLKIIRSLRCANYSLEAILRMLSELSANPNVDIKQALDTPRPGEDIVSVCDKLLTSLNAAEQNAKVMLNMLHKMKRKY